MNYINTNFEIFNVINSNIKFKLTKKRSIIDEEDNLIKLKDEKNKIIRYLSEIEKPLNIKNQYDIFEKYINKLIDSKNNILILDCENLYRHQYGGSSGSGKWVRGVNIDDVLSSKTGSSSSSGKWVRGVNIDDVLSPRTGSRYSRHGSRHTRLNSGHPRTGSFYPKWIKEILSKLESYSSYKIFCIYKSRRSNFTQLFRVLKQKRYDYIEIEVNGLQINNNLHISNSMSTILHDVNGFDDLTIYLIYNICQINNKNTKIYTYDNNINRFDFSVILPYTIIIEKYVFHINPQYIKTDIIVRKIDVKIINNDEMYKRKYLKYKKKYLFLKNNK